MWASLPCVPCAGVGTHRASLCSKQHRQLLTPNSAGSPVQYLSRSWLEAEVEHVPERNSSHDNDSKSGTRLCTAAMSWCSRAHRHYVPIRQGGDTALNSVQQGCSEHDLAGFAELARVWTSGTSCCPHCSDIGHLRLPLVVVVHALSACDSKDTLVLALSEWPGVSMCALAA